MMHCLGASLRGRPGAESPLEMAIRWRYTPIVRFILSLKVYSRDEVEQLFGGTSNKTVVAMIQEYYPRALLTPERGWMSNLVIF